MCLPHPTCIILIAHVPETHGGREIYKGYNVTHLGTEGVILHQPCKGGERNVMEWLSWDNQITKNYGSFQGWAIRGVIYNWEGKCRLRFSFTLLPLSLSLSPNLGQQQTGIRWLRPAQRGRIICFFFFFGGREPRSMETTFLCSTPFRIQSPHKPHLHH